MPVSSFIIDKLIGELGMSRRQLALKANIPPSTLQSALERDKNMTVEMAEKIAEALHVPVSFLLGEWSGDCLTPDLQHIMLDLIRGRISAVTECDAEDLYDTFGTHDYDAVYGDLFDGRRPVSLSRLNEVADQAGVPVEYLTGQILDFSDPVRSIEEQERIRKIETYFDQLTEPGQNEAVKRVEELTYVPDYQKQKSPPQDPQDGNE